MERARGPRGARRALGRLLEAVLADRAEANAVFDILAVLQVRRAGWTGGRDRGVGGRPRAPGAGPRWSPGCQAEPRASLGGLLWSRGAPAGGSGGRRPIEVGGECRWGHGCGSMERSPNGEPEWGPPCPAGLPETGLSPQAEDPEEIQDAVRACSRLFGALLERGELFVGQLPPEETVMAGERPGSPRPCPWRGWRETG